MKEPHITLGSRSLTAHSRPYVIAEIGVNHEGSLDTAKKLIDLAKEGGADAAKFQTYKAHTLASRHSPAYWDISKEPTPSQYELFRKYDGFGPREFELLAAHCLQVGISFASTPFDEDAVDLLAPLMSFFKVASADLTNTPLLRRVAQTGKPVVLSTGASTMEEVDWSVRTLRAAGAKDVALLHCILNYPTANENANLRMLKDLRRAFPQCILGYSDHTVPSPRLNTLVAAWLGGAVILEKHFTHDKSLPGNDHYHAMNIDDLKEFMRVVDEIAPLLGTTDRKEPLESEQISRLNARRSIVIARDLPAGHVITESDITYKRPGTGVSPMFWDEVIGKKTVWALSADDVLQWSDLEG